MPTRVLVTTVRELAIVSILMAVGVMSSPAIRADIPCPPLTNLLEGTPLPPRVGVSGSVTPFSPTDSAIFPANPPFGGWTTRVNITIDASSVDFSVAPTVTYALYRVSGFDNQLEGVFTCGSTAYVSGTETGTTGIWSKTIQKTVLIPDPPWNPPNFYIHVTGSTFADWIAEITPCYVPQGTIAC
jgi:hypothetical protein